MVITVNKDTTPKDLDAALKKLHQDKNKKGLAKYYGKLKGTFGDGMLYQKKLRDEWS
jgi:hypothetical protein